MPRRQLTVAELKLRTTWSKLSRAEQLERLAEEGVFTPGMPDIPPSLCPELEAQFRKVAQSLASKGKLAISDAGLIMQYLRMLEVKNFEEARRIETYLLSRDLGPGQWIDNGQDPLGPGQWIGQDPVLTEEDIKKFIRKVKKAKTEPAS